MTIRLIHRSLFYFLIILLPTQLGLHFWPEWSHVLGRRIDYLSPTLYLTDLILIFIIVFWVLEIVTNHWKYDVRKFILPSTLQSVPSFGFVIPSILLVYILFNILFSLSPALSIYFWYKVFELGLLSAYIGITKPPFFKIKFVLSLTILYSSMVAIVQFLLQHSIGGPLWLLGERTFSTLTGGIAQFSWCYTPITSGCSLILRAYGTFPHPNVLGGFLAVCIPFMYVHTKSFDPAYEKSIRIIRFFSILLGIIALMLTFSRSSLLVGTVGILYLLFNNKGYTYIFLNRFWTILIGIFSLLSVYVIFISLDMSQESVAVRLALNQSAIDIWKSRALLGVGLGNFLVALPSFLPSKFIYFLQPVHNIYLLVLSELGIIGFTLMVFFLWKLRKKMHLHWPIIAMLLLGIFDHYPLTLQQGQLLLAFSVGLLFL